jgi:small subunit ribosomal protein S21
MGRDWRPRKHAYWNDGRPMNTRRGQHTVFTLNPSAIMEFRESEVSCSLAEVHLQDGETLESALRRFKRKVQQEDIIKEIKRHSFYLKPGEKQRTKAALARKRNRKKRTRDPE